MNIKRKLFNEIYNQAQRGDKIVIVYGARQVGKTTLVQSIVDQSGVESLVINADELTYHEILSSRDSRQLRSLIEGYDLIFIDEAQRIENIGINLKIIHDTFPGLKVIVTGSSSFDIANKIVEPLTGRHASYILYPLSLKELSHGTNTVELDRQIEEIMVYGAYPDVYTTRNSVQKEQQLKNITRSYLYKDILELDNIKYSKILRNLTRLLAFQTGSEVSIHELAQILGISSTTVERYIDLLERSFVLFRLPAFARNLRKEITKKDRIYFVDNGVRNAVIDNFKPVQERDDAGKLWENLMISERFKYLSYNQISRSSYYWRTYTGAKIDYIEEGGGKLYGFEFKFSQKKKAGRGYASFAGVYPDSEFQLVNRDSYRDFVL
ncbi:MAG: ATP-binding protein [Candidatus Dojkabacteria bacterium]